MTAAYHARLVELTAARGNLCVGVDPHEPLVRAWGYDYDLVGLERVSRGLVEAIGDQVAVFKPQAAIFECFGAPGMQVLASSTGRYRSGWRPVDPGCQAGRHRFDDGCLLRAYLSGQTDLTADAITISPFLGFDPWPGRELAHQTGCGLYVLCRTSNRGRRRPTGGARRPQRGSADGRRRQGSQRGVRATRSRFGYRRHTRQT